jgi:hypothetical protein
MTSPHTGAHERNTNMSVHYVVEYSDERGNQRQTIYQGETVALYDIMGTVRMLGIDPDTDPYLTSHREAGTVHDNALAYVNAGEPWDSIWDMGDGDNSFSVHGYDSVRGNWMVSLTMVREV